MIGLGSDKKILGMLNAYLASKGWLYQFEYFDLHTISMCPKKSLDSWNIFRSYFLFTRILIWFFIFTWENITEKEQKEPKIIRHVTITDISHNGHNRRWWTFVKPVYFLYSERKMLACFGYFVANLGTFYALLTSAVV